MTEPPGQDPSAFRRVLEKHRERLYYLALDLTGQPADAEDLLQEVFIKAYEGWEKFRGESSSYTWLYRITVNTYLNMQEKQSRGLLELWERFTGEKAVDHREPPPDRGVERSVTQERIEAALQRLTPRERTAFVLKHYHEHSYPAAADIMDVAEGTVKSLVYRAVRKLRKELAFYEEELGL